MCFSRLTQRGSDDRCDLYRIFVYDCKPLAKKAELPISRMAIDLAAPPLLSFAENFMMSCGDFGRSLSVLDAYRTAALGGCIRQY
jgi:hypothetical protein